MTYTIEEIRIAFNNTVREEVPKDWEDLATDLFEKFEKKLTGGAT